VFVFIILSQNVTTHLNVRVCFCNVWVYFLINSSMAIIHVKTTGRFYFPICMCCLIFLWTSSIIIVLLSDAAAQGVQPDQIIFTDVAMKGEHIRRSSLADLFLDT
jgi:hypothetical protein